MVPAWLDELARKIGPQERAWIVQRLAELEQWEFAIDSWTDAEQAEVLRLREVLRTGRR